GPKHRTRARAHRGAGRGAFFAFRRRPGIAEPGRRDAMHADSFAEIALVERHIARGDKCRGALADLESNVLPVDRVGDRGADIEHIKPVELKGRAVSRDERSTLAALTPIGDHIDSIADVFTARRDALPREA